MIEICATCLNKTTDIDMIVYDIIPNDLMTYLYVNDSCDGCSGLSVLPIPLGELGMEPLLYVKPRRRHNPWLEEPNDSNDE